jgi:hypothetical protein
MQHASTLVTMIVASLALADAFGALARWCARRFWIEKMSSRFNRPQVAAQMLAVTELERLQRRPWHLAVPDGGAGGSLRTPASLLKG